MAYVKFAEFMSAAIASNNKDLPGVEFSSYSEFNKVEGSLLDYIYAGNELSTLISDCDGRGTKHELIADSVLRSFSFVLINPDGEVPNPGTVDAIYTRDSNDGAISRVIRLLDALKNVVVPRIRKVQLLKLSEQSAKIQFQASGCFLVDQSNMLWKHADEMGDHLSFWAGANFVSIEGSTGSMIDKDAVLYATIPSAEVDAYLSASIWISCDYNWIDKAKSREQGYINPYSNLIRSRFSLPDSIISNKDFTLGSNRIVHYEINNFRIPDIPLYVYDSTDYYILRFIKKTSQLHIFSSNYGKRFEAALHFDEKSDHYALFLKLEDQSIDEGTIRLRDIFFNKEFLWSDLGKLRSTKLFILEITDQHGISYLISNPVFEAVSAIGEQIELTINNKKYFGIITQIQSDECVNLSRNCLAVPLTTSAIVTLAIEDKYMFIMIISQLRGSTIIINNSWIPFSGYCEGGDCIKIALQ